MFSLWKQLSDSTTNFVIKLSFQRQQLKVRVVSVSYTHLDVYKRQRRLLAGTDDSGSGAAFNQHSYVGLVTGNEV